MLNLLRVGVDSTYGGFWSPIFNDRSYLFIPIPDRYVTKEMSITYSNFLWNNQLIHPYVYGKNRNKILNYTIHNDPEFVTCTYGSPIYSRGRKEKNFSKLRGLSQGDLLVFYAGFTDRFEDINEKNAGYYLFAYFSIQSVIIYETVESIEEGWRQQIMNNHHFIHRWENQIIIVGDRTKSRVFRKAIPLSMNISDRIDCNYYPSQQTAMLLGGYHKSLNRSSLRQFQSSSVMVTFKSFLDENSGENLLDHGFSQSLSM